MLGIGKGRKLPTVLLIDDDMVSREVMATVLTMSGYTIHTAVRGDEAFSILDSATCIPEVILMDVQMPGVNGAALIRELRARSHALLFAISGSDAPPEVLQLADGFLMKPFGPEAVLKLLDQHLPETHPDPPTDLPVVSASTLADFRAMMSESAMREIYAAVTADLERRFVTLEAAIARGDCAEVRRIGHSIKGGCGMAGAAEAARIGELLEAGGDNLEYSRSLLPHFQTAVANLKRMLVAEFSPQGVDPAA